MVYLDYASATPVDPDVLKAMQPWFREQYGNPSSIHQSGQQARAAIDASRSQVAGFLDCQPTEVFFTSSGTESCNWALLGIVEQHMLRGEQAHLVLSEIEHSAVLETARFLERTYNAQLSFVPVTSSGIVDPKQVEQALRPETVLVSTMMVNNEIGTLQPIADIGQLCQKKGIPFHSDACQAAGFYDLNVDALGVDLLSLNAAKLYGPKGVGVLYIRKGTMISPWTFGGAQEFDMRAGTENVPAIVGMGKAIELVQQERHVDSLHSLRDTLWARLQKDLEGLQLNGDLEQRSPNNLNIHIDGIDGASLVKRLDLAGFAISTGSACASGTVEPSHVLLALGLDEEAARSSIRITLGKQTSLDELQGFSQALVEAVTVLRS